jgi:hypothetical protein
VTHHCYNNQNKKRKARAAKLSNLVVGTATTILIIQSDQKNKFDSYLRKFNYIFDLGSCDCIQETPYNL